VEHGTYSCRTEITITDAYVGLQQKKGSRVLEYRAQRIVGNEVFIDGFKMPIHTAL